MFAIRPATLAVSNNAVPVRGMATLKDLRLRLKSVQNIEKITKSMKMVAAAKFARAERELRAARPYGQSATQFYEHAEAKLDADENTKQMLMVAVTSDRGLCGAVHSNIIRSIRNRLTAMDGGTETGVKTPKDVRLVLIGDKSKAVLGKSQAKRVLMSVNDVGRQPPIFADASAVAEEMLDFWAKQGEASKESSATVVYNVFRSVVSYKTTTQALPVPQSTGVANASKLSLYDGLDDNMIQCFNEFALANVLFYTMREGQTSEQSSRMTAMDAASKNAGEMISKLTIQMNRTRQAVITRELVEIIAGAAALK